MKKIITNNVDLYFSNDDIFEVIKEVEEYILKDCHTTDGIEDLKSNYLYLAIYEITSLFTSKCIEINNCITYNGARIICRTLYEQLLFIKYIQEDNSQSNQRAKRYIKVNEYRRLKIVQDRIDDVGFSEEEKKQLIENIELIYYEAIRSFKESKLEIKIISSNDKWYMEKNNTKKLSNIYELSKYLGMEGEYERIYRAYSNDTHSLGSSKNEILKTLKQNFRIKSGKFEETENFFIEEIELSGFTNFIISEFIKEVSKFIKKPELWKKHEKSLQIHSDEKWRYDNT